MGHSMADWQREGGAPGSTGRALLREVQLGWKQTSGGDIERLLRDTHSDMMGRGLLWLHENG